ncbi:MAG: YraN family protein [Propionibacteriaceae bacterium]|jgi:putative endonuclease|nr:YraN family protein [Propionibacteriaceae bacterium]
MDRRQQAGREGEEIAARYLEHLGWSVIERNWRHGRDGEIDIVARQPEPAPGGALVICEVKTRRGMGFGSPLEAITVAKVRTLKRLAGAWLAEHPGHWAVVRIDAIGVLVRPGQEPDITHERDVTR